MIVLDSSPFLKYQSFVFFNIYRMNSENVGNLENEWIVLDKVIAVAHALGEHTELNFMNNGREITLKLKHLKLSCGFTPEICKRLFSKGNFKHRKELENLGIKFPNHTQGYEERKIEINYECNPPNLYKRFVADIALPLAALPEAANDQAGAENGLAAENAAPDAEFPKMIEM